VDKQTTAEESAGTLRGLRIQTLSLWMVAATLVVSVLIGDGIIHVMRDHKKLAEMTKEYIHVQEKAEDLLLGSNYLTDQVRLYAVTKDLGYAEAYFVEAEETRRIDKALDALDYLMSSCIWRSMP